MFTLKNRISGRVKHGTKPGPQSYLTPEEESELADFLVNACKMGSYSRCEEAGREEERKRES